MLIYTLGRVHIAFVGIYILCNVQRDTDCYDINTDIYISFPDC